MSSTDPLPRRSILLAIVTLVGVGVAGCSSGKSSKLAYHASGMPLWEGNAIQLFDDAIDAAAVGLSMEGPSPRFDRLLRERAQTADVVARVKVSTVTVETAGEEQRYRLGVQVGQPTLAKPRIEDRTFELVIRSNSKGYAVARAFDTRLRDMTFVAFITRFMGSDGEPEVHFHLAADTREVADAVKEAVALGELEGG